MIGRNLAHYRIVEKIGTGGMGVVYRAQDEQLLRDVAIKILPAGSLEDADSRRRFKQEALVLARINHPNIATLFGTGAENGIDFLVMEFIPGISLSDRLRSGPLPIDEVLALGAQISEGLAAAHKSGIIHRDVKPGNILVTPEGRIKVLDFGLARGAPRASESGASITASQLHETSGTIPYMSPEQLRGQIADERSDVWGAGAVLYELCCGQRPFHGSNPTATAADIIHQQPRPPRAIRPDVPVGLEKIIQKCLEKEPANRYQSAEQLLNDIVKQRDGNAVKVSALSWSGAPAISLTIAASVVVLTTIVILSIYFTRTPHVNGKARRSVAVLGFKNVKGVEGQDWISTALSEMLTTELAAGEEVRTVSGEDIVHAKMDLKLSEAESLGQGTLKQIKSRLGTDLVVAGSYLDINGQLRVDVRLQDASDGTIVANLSESGSEDQLFDIVARTGAALRARAGIGNLTSAQLANVRASQPANLAAAKLYAEGLALLRQFDAQGARDKFEAAIRSDPSDALSHAALATALSRLGYDQSASQQAKIAFDLSKNLAREDHLTIEGAYHTARKDWERAIDVYRTLYGYFPDRLDYGVSLADAQVAAGKGKDALTTIARMRRPGVNDPRIDLAEGRAAASLSDFRRAVAANARAADAAAKEGASFERAQALQQQCWANRNLGHLDEAGDAGTTSQAIFQQNRNARGEARSLTCVASVLSDKGDLDSARRMYEEALDLVQGIGARLEIAGALNNIGNTLAAQGKVEESTAKYQQALAVAKEIADKPDQLRAQSNIGLNLMILGEFRKAQAALQSSRETARSVGNQQGAAESLINLASVSLYLGDLKQAELQVKEALLISRSLSLPADVAYALTAAGDVQLAKDDLTAAARSYKESFEIRKQLGEGSGIAAGQLSLATLAVEQGNLEQALQVARDAAENLHKLGDADQETVARTLLASILIRQNKVAQSQTELDIVGKLSIKDSTALLGADIAAGQLLALKKKPAEAIRRLEKVLDRAKSMEYVPGYMQAMLAIAEIRISTGEHDSAARELQSVRDQALRLGFKLLQRKAEELSQPQRPRVEPSSSAILS